MAGTGRRRLKTRCRSLRARVVAPTSLQLAHEIALTVILMFVISVISVDLRDGHDVRAIGAGAALAIGGTVTLDALFGLPVTGASMNPARSLGPALAAGEWRDLWVYVVGPPVGAALGALA